MAFANTSYTDIISTTIEARSRSGECADNMSDNNALLKWLRENDGQELLDGGIKIIKEILFADNGTVAPYSGLDTLSVAGSDVISAAEFAWKQYAGAVVVSGLEKRQNAGRARKINLVTSRVTACENSLKNSISAGLYSDGTGSGSKVITGLLACAPVVATTGTYGGINRATAGNEFWRSYAGDTNAAPSASTIQGFFNTAWANLTRGSDHPNLILVDNTTWAAWAASVQLLQRFTTPQKAKLGFSTMQYMDADIVLDGGIGGNCTSVTAFFLNTKHLHWSVHEDMNFAPLTPETRSAVNQDAEVKHIGFMGNLTCSNASLQGQIVFS